MVDNGNDNKDEDQNDNGANGVKPISQPSSPSASRPGRPSWRRNRNRRGASKNPFQSTGALPDSGNSGSGSNDNGNGNGNRGSEESVRVSGPTDTESIGKPGSKSPAKGVWLRECSGGNKKDKDEFSSSSFSLSAFDRAVLRLEIMESLKCSSNVDANDVLEQLFGTPRKNSKGGAGQACSVEASGQTLESVGGLTDQVKTIRTIIKAFVQHKTLKETWGLEAAPRGILFHGPPGTGKTLLAHTIVGELATFGINATFLVRRGSDLFDKYVGESEKKIQEFFSLALKKRPAVVFLDELDALCPDRNEHAGTLASHNASAVCALLGAMETIPRGEVLVIGATNRPTAIDPALKRPGRFDREIYFTLPNVAGRKQILRIHTKKWMKLPPEENLDFVAVQTEGYTGADLEQLCRNVFNCALERAEQDPETTSGRTNFELSSSGSDDSIEKKHAHAIGRGIRLLPQSGRFANARGGTAGRRFRANTYANYGGLKPRIRNKNETFRQILEHMQVLLCDWEQGLHTSRRSCYNVFGNFVFSPIDLNKEMKLLLGSIVKELQAKLESSYPNHAVDTENPNHGIKNLGLLQKKYLKMRPFQTSGVSLTIVHFWTNSPTDVIILNTHIVPAILAAIDPEKVPSYLFDFKCVRGSSRSTTLGAGGVSSLFDQIDSATQDTCILFAPSFPAVWDRLDQSPEIQETFVQRFEATRGRKIVLVLTSSGTNFLSRSLPESMLWLKNCEIRSTEVRKPSDEERNRFFDVLLKGGAKSTVTGIEQLMSTRGQNLFMKFKARLEEQRNILVKHTKNESLGSILTVQGKLVLMFKNLSSSAGQAASHIFLTDDEVERLVFYQDYVHRVLLGVRGLINQLTNPDEAVGTGVGYNSVYI